MYICTCVYGYKLCVGCWLVTKAGALNLGEYMFVSLGCGCCRCSTDVQYYHVIVKCNTAECCGDEGLIPF